MKKRWYYFLIFPVIVFCVLFVIKNNNIYGSYDYESTGKIYATLKIMKNERYEICYKTCQFGAYRLYAYGSVKIITFEAGPMSLFGKDSGAILESGDRHLGNDYRFTVDTSLFGPRIVNDGGGEDDYNFFRKDILGGILHPFYGNRVG